MAAILRDHGYDILCDNCMICYAHADFGENPPAAIRYKKSYCPCCSKPKKCDENCFCRREL